MPFDKSCGGFRLTVSNPSPAWATIFWEASELRLIQEDDLRDLKYLIERALERPDAW